MLEMCNISPVSSPIPFGETYSGVTNTPKQRQDVDFLRIYVFQLHQAQQVSVPMTRAESSSSAAVCAQKLHTRTYILD